MEITREFLQQEIAELESELAKAKSFATQAQAVIDSYQMLLRRLDADPPEAPEARPEIDDSRG